MNYDKRRLRDALLRAKEKRKNRDLALIGDKEALINQRAETTLMLFIAARDLGKITEEQIREKTELVKRDMAEQIKSLITP